LALQPLVALSGGYFGSFWYSSRGEGSGGDAIVYAARSQNPYMGMGMV
jgi:hypothetical protein